MMRAPYAREGEMSRLKITILNWKKHQPRKSGDPTYRQHWFKVTADMATDPKLHNLTPAGKWIWVCILTNACNTHGEFEMKPKWFCNHFKVNPRSLRTTLERLQNEHVIQVSEIIENTIPATLVNYALQNRTEQNRTEQDTKEAKSESGSGSGSGDFLILLWNEFSKLPKVKTITAYLRNLSRDAFREQPSVDFWRTLFKKVEDTPFLTGKNKTGWVADLHWILSRGNYGKVADSPAGRMNELTEDDWKDIFKT